MLFAKKNFYESVLLTILFTLFRVFINIALFWGKLQIEFLHFGEVLKPQLTFLEVTFPIKWDWEICFHFIVTLGVMVNPFMICLECIIFHI